MAVVHGWISSGLAGRVWKSRSAVSSRSAAVRRFSRAWYSADGLGRGRMKGASMTRSRSASNGAREQECAADFLDLGDVIQQSRAGRVQGQ